MKSLIKNNLDDYEKNYDKTSKYKFIQNSISNNDIDDIFINRSLLQDDNKTYSNKVYDVENLTNQKKSGRCWLFSFTNLLRHELIKKYNLDGSFELSQNYLFFYDKLEKSEYFLTNIYRYRNKDITGKHMKFFLETPTSDGGFWNMAMNLVTKYGIVPKVNMNESYQSSNSDKLNYFLNQNLKRYAKEIRDKNFSQKEFEEFLKDRLFTIYRLLSYFLGTPPKKFDWEYEDVENKKVIIKENLTPLTFFKKYVNIKPEDYVVLVNLPIPELPFYKKYKLRFCNNMLSGNEAECINLPIKLLKRFTKRSIDGKNPVWFGSDIDKYSDKKKGIASRKLYDYSLLYDKEVDELDKGNKVLYNQSKPVHAMLILGYNKVGKKIDKWLVENSWGSDAPSGGFMNIQDDWFSYYVYELAVKKKYLDDTVRDIVNSDDYTVIKPWDYFNCEALYVF